MLLQRIEAVGGLVEDQHLRVVHDGLRQADAALEAFREGFDGLLQHRFELQPADDVIEPRLAVLALQRAQVGDEIQEPVTVISP